MKGEMKVFKTRSQTALTAVAAAALAALAIAGCGGSSGPPQQPASKLVRPPGSTGEQIVLSQVGAQRIGIQTSPAQRLSAGSPKAMVVVPYSAIVYDASGQTYAFKQLRPLVFAEVPVKVDHIAGGSAYLAQGPAPGIRVVSVGAEELYGVQSGVLSQT